MKSKKTKRSKEVKILWGVIAIVMIAGFWFSLMPLTALEREYRYSGERIFCSEESRLAEICIMIYAPVCGSDRQTYSNDCFACMNPDVVFYTLGEC